ncbi:SDR family oxidoreductase [Akkermansiaceae bacterium]|jgi:NAD(P)-dependent dehydrogenase (short-subunit alcohol dehydrogenase family)|nr:SDR family oxidoreductase [Akkermansiaceae bacterium]
MIIWLTGCTAGLGRALVKEFSSMGHTVVGCGRNEIALQKLRNAYPGNHFFAADVSRDESARAFCDQALLAAGEPDFLINNAATINNPAPLWEVSAEEFDRLMSINVSGVANILRHALPSMIANKKGIVVNLSSGWGRSTSPEVAPYCASKWAIEGLTKSLSQELPASVAAVSLNPGVIATDMLRTCYGADAEDYQGPEAWAITAAPYILELTTHQNGQAVTAP